MTIMVIQDLEKDGKVVATLRVYWDGNGNPADKHNLVGFSIDGIWQGETDKPPHIDKVDDTLGAMKL